MNWLVDGVEARTLCSAHNCFTGAIAAWLMLALVSAALAHSLPPQLQLKAYPLKGNLEAADISADERLALTEVTELSSSPEEPSVKAAEKAQLWDFRHTRLVAETLLEERTVTKAQWGWYRFHPRFARFTADGELAIVYADPVLYVLNARNLRTLRKIQPNRPPELERSFNSGRGVHHLVDIPRLSFLELSPIGHEAAMIWTRNFDFAEVEVYDLDTGSELGQWNTREKLGVTRPTALAWTPDGGELVIAAPNAMRCSPPNAQPDIFEVNAVSGALRKQLTSGLLVGDIAVGPDRHVWAVDYDCIGVFQNHHPKLRVFDLETGKRLKELAGRGSGVRYAVSISRNGDRVAAYTGRMKVDFDWGDMVAWGAVVDRTFSVWNTLTYDAVTTSEVVPSRGKGRFAPPGEKTILRLSAGGHFVLFGDTIYELPDTAAKN